MLLVSAPTSLGLGFFFFFFIGGDAGNAILAGNDAVRTTSGVFWRIGSEMAAARSPPEPPKWG